MRERISAFSNKTVLFIFLLFNRFLGFYLKGLFAHSTSQTFFLHSWVTF